MSKSIEETEVTVLNPNLETRAAKRNFLRSLSKDAELLVESGECETVNEYLLILYQEQEGEEAEFHTYKQWRKLGHQVKKGESAFLVWGRPRKIESEEDAKEAKEGESEEENSKKDEFYPLAYLFSSNQVEPREKGGKNVK
jgi:antirestriction protein ArdC